MDIMFLLKENICATIVPVMTILGYVIFAIKIAVPVILILMGMLDLAKAMTEKDEGAIKKAQGLLIKRAIAAIMVYLVITIVGLIMNLLSQGNTWKQCTDCAFDPGNACCYVVDETGNHGQTMSGKSAPNDDTTELTCDEYYNSIE